MTKLIILDRDGIINQDSLYYIKSADEFIPIAGSIEAIAQLTKAGYTVAVATNQSGVSRGLYSLETLAAIHDKMLKIVEDAGGKISAIEFCTHLPWEYCTCRKPQPGMLLALSERLECGLKGVPFVGDRVSDIQAAYSAGATPVLVLSPMTDLVALAAYPEVPVYNSLKEYVNVLLKQP